jgi:hypothetical protein
MDQRTLSHDILNLLERLRIMHDLARDKNFQVISQAEMTQDLEESLKELKEKFQALLAGN